MTTLAVDVYKDRIKLGAGSIDTSSASLTSYSGTAPRQGRNIAVAVTTAGAVAGRSWRTRILTDGGATLTLRDACPFA